MFIGTIQRGLADARDRRALNAAMNVILDELMHSYITVARRDANDFGPTHPIGCYIVFAARDGDSAQQRFARAMRSRASHVSAAVSRRRRRHCARRRSVGMEKHDRAANYVAPTTRLASRLRNVTTRRKA